MDERNEMRTYLNAVTVELDGAAGPHPSLDALTDYHQGRLSESEGAAVRDHLVACDECLALFKDANAFFAPPPDGHEGVSHSEIHGEWKALWRQIKAGQETAETVASRAAARWHRGTWPLALAASLALAFSILLTWFLWSRQDLMKTTTQLQLEQTEMAERLKQLEEQNRQLREQPRGSEAAKSEQENQRLRQEIESLQRRHEAEIAELRRPQVNAPLYDVLPQEMTVRSPADNEVTRIELPPGKRSFTLILNGEGLPPYPKYDIEIRDRSGKRVWLGEGLRQASGGNFVLTLDRSFLKRGQYRLRLIGRSSEGAKAIAHYNISIITKP